MKPTFTDIQKKIMLAIALPAALLLLACALIPPKVTGLYRAHHVQELENSVDRMARFTDALFEERIAQLRLLAATHNWHEAPQSYPLNALLQAVQTSPLRITAIGIFDVQGNLLASAKTLLDTTNTASGTPDATVSGITTPDMADTNKVWLREVQIKEIFIGSDNPEAATIIHSSPFPTQNAVPKISHPLFIAVQEKSEHGPIIVKATVETTQLLPLLATASSSVDSFFINNNGMLETESRFLGPAMAPSGINQPTTTRTMTNETLNGQHYLLFKAQLRTAPWALVLAENETRVPMSVTHANMLFLRCLGAAFLALAFCTWHILQLTARYQLRHNQGATLTSDSNHCSLEQDTKKMAEAITAGIIHDMSARLMLIREYAGWMTDLLHDETPEAKANYAKFHHSIEKIEESVDLANDISHSLLLFIRHESALVAPLFLAPLVQDTVDSLQRLANSHTTDIYTHIEAKELQVTANAGQLKQILLNILSNAIDAISAASPQNSLSSRGAIVITIKKIRDSAIVTIKDNGAGISPEHLGKLFEPFYTANKPEKGTGLGLFMCASILTSLGGGVTAANAPEGGAIFTVTLPLTKVF